MKEKKEKLVNRVFYTNDDISLKSPARTLGGIAVIRDGDIYRAFDKITTICGRAEFRGNDGSTWSGSASIKSAKGFSSDIDLAYQCLNIWRELGYKGAPTSPASFMREAFRRAKKNGVLNTRCYASANHFRGFLQGGWIESGYTGFVHSPVYHYDINRAYLSAISDKGLPSRLYPYQKGMSGFVVLAENIKGKNLPKLFGAKRGLLTNEDLENFPIDSFDVISGVSFRDLDVNLNSVLYTLSDLPERAFKLLTQSYWGIFAMRNPVEVTYRRGSTRSLMNYFQNVCWAQIIIRRVMGALYRRAIECDAFSVFVDSMLCTKELDPGYVGSDPGQFKLVDYYERGVYIGNPGLWNPLPFNPRSVDRSCWARHAGIPGH